MEYCGDGTISDVSRLGLPEAMIRKYADQILIAVEFLHDRGILHRDIKGEACTTYFLYISKTACIDVDGKVLHTFFILLINPPDIRPSVYKPTRNPLRSCISPGLISSSLRYTQAQVARVNGLDCSVYSLYIM